MRHSGARNTRMASAGVSRTAVVGPMARPPSSRTDVGAGAAPPGIVAVEDDRQPAPSRRSVDGVRAEAQHEQRARAVDASASTTTTLAMAGHVVGGAGTAARRRRAAAAARCRRPAPSGAARCRPARGRAPRPGTWPGRRGRRRVVPHAVGELLPAALPCGRQDVDVGVIDEERERRRLGVLLAHEDEGRERAQQHGGGGHEPAGPAVRRPLAVGRVADVVVVGAERDQAAVVDGGRPPGDRGCRPR